MRLYTLGKAKHRRHTWRAHLWSSGSVHIWRRIPGTRRYRGIWRGRWDGARITVAEGVPPRMRLVLRKLSASLRAALKET